MKDVCANQVSIQSWLLIPSAWVNTLVSESMTSTARSGLQPASHSTRLSLSLSLHLDFFFFLFIPFSGHFTLGYSPLSFCLYLFLCILNLWISGRCMVTLRAFSGCWEI